MNLRLPLGRLCRAIAVFLLAVLAVHPVSAAEGLEQTTVTAESRQILVMLHMPPQHYRPNSAYGGNYGDTMARAARNRTAMGIAKRAGLHVVESWPMPLLAIDCYVMTVPKGMRIEDAIGQVAKNPAVAWSQPMNTFSSGSSGPQSINDPLYRVQPTASEWHLAAMQQFAVGRGMKVAIIDSMIDVHHPDLEGQFIRNQDFIGAPAGRGEQHGTGIAGVIGARAGNGIGIAGVAPGARLMALRACQEQQGGVTLCRSIGIARAMQYAIENRADIINLSLSGPADPLLASLVNLAISRDIAIVAAFDPQLPRGGFPAAVPGVIAVADESSHSLPNWVYGAPGRDIPTTLPGGGWNFVDGTSYAVAQVSGLVALVGEKGNRFPRAALVRGLGGRIQACTTLLGKSRLCE